VSTITCDQVHLEHGLQVTRWRTVEGRAAHIAGVVNDGVNAAVAVNRVTYQRVTAGGLADIGVAGDRFTAGIAYLCDHPIGRRVIAVIGAGDIGTIIIDDNGAAKPSSRESRRSRVALWAHRSTLGLGSL